MIYLSVFLSYILGSIPVGYIVTRMVKGVDVRKYGSGNIGATNVARVAGKTAGILTLVLDILKGFLAVTVISGNSMHRIACALAVIIGHNWTIFLGFHGGKGVAVTAGAFIGLAPSVFVSGLCVWMIVFIITKYVSLASIISAIFLPVFLIIYKEPFAVLMFGTVVSVIGILRHKENIKRLAAGKEKKIKLWGR